ncbi:MAG: glycosyltransferase family 4 protein [Nitrosotalea sp.]
MSHSKILVYSLTTSYVRSVNAKLSSFVHNLNKELTKQGIDVKVITPHSKNALTREIMDSVIIKRFRYLPENYEINSGSIPDAISTSKLGFIRVGIMVLGFFISTFFECLGKKPNILHGHWAFPGGFVAFIMSKIFSKKFIVSIHGSDIAMLKKFKFLKNIVINSLNKSSCVIANSNFTKNEMMSLGVKSEKIIKINVPPNFVNHTSDANFLGQFRNKFVSPDKKIILFVGRLVEVKGIEYLIRALKEIEAIDPHLIIVGEGILLTQLQNLTRSLGLESKVTFYGGANHEELGWLYDISDVFVLPSVEDSKGTIEGLGLVVVEAMESGLPVIGTSLGGILDTIKHEKTGLLVKQKDPVEIAKAIERVMLDDNLRKKLIKNSKEIVKEFSPEIIAKQYYNIFQKIVS